MLKIWVFQLLINLAVFYTINRFAAYFSSHDEATQSRWLHHMIVGSGLSMVAVMGLSIAYLIVVEKRKQEAIAPQDLEASAILEQVPTSTPLDSPLWDRQMDGGVIVERTGNASSEGRESPNEGVFY